MSYPSYQLQPIGQVESPLLDRASAPKQGNEGSPEAWLAFHARVSEGLRDVRVFNTRSPDRPNPIGLHRVRILAIEGTRMRVRDLEAIDRTPSLDVKPVLDRNIER